MDRIRRNIYISDEYWSDLGKLAKLMDTTRAKVIRETLEQTVSTLKKAFGGDLDLDKVDMANYYRTMLLETSKALGQVADTPGQVKKK